MPTLGVPPVSWRRRLQILLLLLKYRKKVHLLVNLFCLVRVTGLEPVRRRHTPLKRACLPIPAHSHRYSVVEHSLLYHQIFALSIIKVNLL